MTDKEWREWSERIGYDGSHRATVLRSALALKLLLFSLGRDRRRGEGRLHLADQRIAEHGARVFYKLDGGLPPEEREIQVRGCRGSGLVRVGNGVARQHQHGIHGDIFEDAFRFVEGGNILDRRSVQAL